MRILHLDQNHEFLSSELEKLSKVIIEIIKKI